jgi:predicted GNAT family acetyltransferase
MVLHVNTANRPAVAAYERVGFRRHSTLRLILSF